MAIHKITLTVTTLVEADTLGQAVNNIGNLSLRDVADEMDDGLFIGTYSVTQSETVAPENVEDELLAVGNDGTFFSTGDEDDPDYDDDGNLRPGVDHVA